MLTFHVYQCFVLEIEYSLNESLRRCAANTALPFVLMSSCKTSYDTNAGYVNGSNGDATNQSAATKLLTDYPPMIMKLY